jgi:hypothetical protein
LGEAGRPVNKEGKPVSVAGSLLNQAGKLLNDPDYLADRAGRFVDAAGRLQNEDGGRWNGDGGAKTKRGKLLTRGMTLPNLNFQSASHQRASASLSETRGKSSTIMARREESPPAPELSILR